MVDDIEDICIKTPSELYEELSLLKPNVNVLRKPNEGSSKDILLQIKKYHLYGSSNTQKRAVAKQGKGESSHVPETDAKHIISWLSDGWEYEKVGEKVVGSNVEYELILLPPESVL